MSAEVVKHKFDRMLRSAVLYESDWRKANQLNFAYYDGTQWTEEQIRAIENRGQQATVINTVAPTVDMVLAQEVNRKVDIQVVGREESDSAKADLMTELLKHVFDTCHFDYYHSAAFKEALIGGRGWMECSVKDDESGRKNVSVDIVPWENVYLDPFSRKPDASDASFIIKTKWIDRELLEKIYPEKADEIQHTFIDEYEGQEWEAQLTSGDRIDTTYYDPKGRRVMVCECWYRVPEKYSLEVEDEISGEKVRKNIIRQAVHYVCFSDDVILDGSADDDSLNRDPLGVNIIPLIPVYCNRDRHGRPTGIVSRLVDLQDQINKLNSKFLWTIASNRIIVENDATNDIDEMREQYQRPDGVVVLNENGLSKVRIDDHYRDLSYMSAHLNFMLSTEQRISGVNDSMLGLGGVNERSGTMQNTRISQGAAMQTTIMENLYFSKQRIAYTILRLIGKFYTDYRIVRITQPNGTTDNIEFNTPVIGEDGKKTGEILNKIEDTIYYDVLLKKVPPFDAMRDRQLTIFSEVFKSGVIPPEIAAKMMLQYSDMPGKQDLIREVEAYYAEQKQAAMAAQSAGMPTV